MFADLALRLVLRVHAQDSFVTVKLVGEPSCTIRIKAVACQECWLKKSIYLDKGNVKNK